MRDREREGRERWQRRRRRRRLTPAAPSRAALAATPPDPRPVVVAGRRIAETGPFATLHPVLDGGARRLLPGHLLRRARVTASLPLGPSAAVVRTSITGVTGEEGVLTWDLVAAAGGGWLVARARRDGGGDAAAAAAAGGGPHPRLGPEAVVLAVAAAAARGDTAGAARFAAGGRAAAAALAAALAGAPPAPAVADVASPTPRTALVACEATGGGKALAWSLCVRDSGAWAVAGVEPW